MISKLSLYLLISLCVLHNVFAEQESHSLQKRQTTVTSVARHILNILPRDISRTVAGIDLGTVGVLIIAFLVLDIVGTIIFAGVVGAGRSHQSGWFSGLSNIGHYMSSYYNSIDVVDTAFNYMDIEEEVCRLKTVCEMESYAVNHPLARLAINTINSSLKGLERYQDAVDAGIEGQDCALLYDQCPYSYFGY